MTPVPIGPHRAILGEGPLWQAVTGALLWIDIRGARLNRTDPASGQTISLPLPEAPGAVALTSRGPMLAMGQSLVLDGANIARLPPGQPGRFNDGKTDPSGRFWVGTANAEGRADCALWRFDGQFVPVLSGVVISNGLGWSPDGRRLHYVDTGAGCLDSFDCKPDGGLSNRRTLLRLPPGHLPDGLSVDILGRIWLALWGGGCVLCVTPEGRIDNRIDLPTPLVTSCAFGGPDLRTLFITTARPDAGHGPLDGALFAVQTATQGLPVAEVKLHPVPAPSRDHPG
jgi:sugar lactone lactonase YvrE